jgi:glycosyltransferase involved in cell wall biosynthesis
MKVAWLCPYPINNLPEIRQLLKGNLSGMHPSSWIVTLSNELLNHKEIDLHIITLSNRTNKYIYQKIGHNFHVIPSGIPFIYKGFPSWLPIDRITFYKNIINKINGLLSEIKPDIVHGYGTEGPYGLTAVKSNFKHLISIQGIVNYIKYFEPSVTSSIQSKIEMKTVQSGSNYGCRTDWDKKFVRDLNPRAKIFHISEAIGDIFFKSVWDGIESNDILIVGSICERKGTEFLLNSIQTIIKNFPKLKFNFVGNGSEKFINKMKSLSKKLSIEKYINWIGYKNSLEIAKLLSNSRFYIHPSYIDNSPNSLLEAMAVGAPSIASAVGGIPSMVQGESIIKLFDINDKEDFISKVWNLLSNKELSFDISKRSKQFVQRNNKPEIVSKITVDIYNQIINSQILLEV